MMTSKYKVKAVCTLILILLASNVSAGFFFDEISKNGELDKASTSNGQPTESPSFASYASDNKQKNNNIAYEFDPGEILELKSPDQKNIRSLSLPVFRGKPRFGIQDMYLTNDYYKKNSESVHKTKKSRLELIKKKQSSLGRFRKILDIKNAGSTLNNERLKNNFKSGKFYARTNVVEDSSWYMIIRSLASSNLTLPTYADYMCSTEACSKIELKQYDSGLHNRGNGFWGGYPSNEFKARRAFAKFIDSELDKFFKWTRNEIFDSEVYLVGSTHLSEYQFDKGGFFIRLKPISTWLGTGENLKDVAALKPTRYARGESGTFVKVDESKAEKLQERTLKKTLFYTYKVKLTVSNKSNFYKSTTRDVLKMHYKQEITSDFIEVFLDEALTDKLFDVPVNIN